MTTIDKAELLAHAATRVSHQQGFLSNIFSRYQALEGITENDLAQLLNCSLADYYLLALCRTPATDRSFAKQVEHIAAYRHASVTTLAQVIRRVEAAEVFRAETFEGDQGMLSAAREKHAPEADDV